MADESVAGPGFRGGPEGISGQVPSVQGAAGGDVPELADQRGAATRSVGSFRKERAMSVLTVTVYRSRWRREWRWRATASNGRKMVSGGEGYRNRGDCITAAFTVLVRAAVVLDDGSGLSPIQIRGGEQ